jgi:DNA-binding transcriptional regulator YbjK
MPPFNEARRDRLADAAIELLARHGSRGLTHRAVDVEADEPPGTTSRYFRTRDALMTAVVNRARALHFAELRGAPQGTVDRVAVARHLTQLVHNALTRNRSRHLAMFELFLESTRRPGLQAALTETRAAQNALIRDLHRSAGIALTEAGAALLVDTISGFIFAELTSLADPRNLRSRIQTTIRLLLPTFEPVGG